MESLSLNVQSVTYKFTAGFLNTVVPVVMASVLLIENGGNVSKTTRK